MLCGGLDRDYKAMSGDGWDIIYVPPSPMTTPWEVISDAQLRKLYWTGGKDKQTRITIAKNIGAGRPERHRPPKPEGLMSRILAIVASKSPKACSADEIRRELGAVTRAEFQRGRGEISRLTKDGRLVRVGVGLYSLGRTHGTDD